MQVPARLIAGVVVLLGSVFGAQVFASAAEDWQVIQKREQAARTVYEQEQAALAPLQAKLKSTPREDWTPTDIDAYLAQQLRTLNAYLGTRMSNSLDAPWTLLEVLLKHDQPWEFSYNPLRTDAQGNWLPTRELTVADPFSPGDVVYQFCPPERFSLHEGWPRASSYELSIYGATEDCGGYSGQAPLVTPGNASWAQVPPGSLLQLGRYTEPMPADALLPAGEMTALQYAQQQHQQRERGLAYFSQELGAVRSGPNYRPYWAIRQFGSMELQWDEQKKLAAALQAKPREQWTTDEINAYLMVALWLVYLPCLAANDLDPLEANSIEALTELRVMRQMPPNPLAGWRPMRLLPPEAGFSAGDACLQSPPPAFQSDINGAFWENSMVITIYGADPTVTSEAANLIPPQASDWAQALPGTVWGLSSYREHRAYSEFERVVAWDGVGEPQMLREDGSRRRIPGSIASRIIPRAEAALRSVAPDQFEAELRKHLRKMAMCVFQACELYKYEHGALPADPRELVGDYLDVWPGDPLHPNADGSWPPLPVVFSEQNARPGALLWQPGYASASRWVQVGLRQNGGFGDPALAYRLTLYMADPAKPGSASAVIVIDAPAETQMQIVARSRGSNTDYIEELFSRRAPQRSVWPAPAVK